MSSSEVSDEEINEYVDLFLRPGPPRSWSQIQAQKDQRRAFLVRCKNTGAFDRLKRASEAARKDFNDEVSRQVQIWLKSELVDEARIYLNVMAETPEQVEELLKRAATSEVMMEMETGTPRASAEGLALSLWQTRNSFSLVTELKFQEIIKSEDEGNA